MTLAGWDAPVPLFVTLSLQPGTSVRGVQRKSRYLLHELLNLPFLLYQVILKLADWGHALIPLATRNQFIDLVSKLLNLSLCIIEEKLDNENNPL